MISVLRVYKCSPLQLALFTIKSIIQSKLSQRSPCLFNLLLGNTTFRRYLDFHGKLETATCSELSEHAGIEIHPFLRRYLT